MGVAAEFEYLSQPYKTTVQYLRSCKSPCGHCQSICKLFPFAAIWLQGPTRLPSVTETGR